MQTLLEAHVEQLVHYARALWERESFSTGRSSQWMISDSYQQLLNNRLEFELEGRHLRMAALVAYNLRPLSRLLSCGRSSLEWIRAAVDLL